MTECPICLDIIDDKDMILLECCQMKFCAICLPEWFRKSGNATCPICHKILDEFYIPIEENSEVIPEEVITNSQVVVRLKVTAFLIVKFILGKIYWSLSNTH